MRVKTRFTPLFLISLCLSSLTLAADLKTDIVGTWASADERLRIEFHQDGRFIEDYNGKKAAYRGRYVVNAETFTLNEQSGISVPGQRQSNGQLAIAGFLLDKQPSAR